MSKPHLGVQLYSLREELAADFDGTIEKVAEMGFAAVEPWGDLPTDFRHAARVFERHGLNVVSAHLPPLVGADRQKWLDAADLLHLQTIVLPYLPPEHFTNADTLARTADLINESAAAARAAGFGYGYHNHWWEFAYIDDIPALYRLADLLDPSVIFEVDVYWAQVAGLDPVQVVRDLGARAPLLHLKDGPADSPDSPMVAAGDGEVDLKTVVQASQAAWGFVELDKCATDMTEAVSKSARYFLSNGLAEGKA
ncbi:MAG: sugar phosphate isomerase/epimerase [Anaerolineae bacterium]|jgi:sugar phosphate isomerase/epimerase|nr:sugar phosphate isomerase/epimerase [Anaerolineae bacterium]